MSKLRLLKLDTALPQHTVSRPIWPEGFAAVYPWPELEDLQISFPCVNDQLYSHLPSTLRRLSLRAFPHRIVHSWGLDWRPMPAWKCPVQTAGQMHRILHRCDCPHLEYLEVEYDQDDEEEEPLRTIVELYPRLVSLKIIRYANLDASKFDIAQFGQLLRRLGHLKDVSLHLGLATTPRVSLGRRGFMIPHDAVRRFQAANHKMFDQLVRCLGPSVELVKFLEPLGYGCWNEWTPYKVVHKENGRRTLCALCLE
ncbi:hypothetical protein GY45DRAFT_204363 [Cubamyces sp. BRFM 1775]|nr:hypothetical protein GY45DRAFT_204363 [Cubamyces sp. BRFM 1775]